MRSSFLLFMVLLALQCAPPVSDLDPIAERYVHLVLSLGEHDKNAVDAFYGPQEWKALAREEARSLPDIIRQAQDLQNTLDKLELPADEQSSLRKTFLRKQLGAVKSWAEHLSGVTRTFDEESELLFDARAPVHDEAVYATLLEELDGLLPGSGPVGARWDTYRAGYRIPPEKLDTVFRAAVLECRKRTAARMALPEEESFTIEYVTGKPWSGYNWYQGNAQSRIQVNTDLPISIDRAVDLAAHEGYPGHHVYNALLESRLLKKNGWVEFSVYPLFSPQSLVAEGSANFGIDVVLPGDERVAFEKAVLFPLAGLDPGTAAQYYRVLSVVNKLSYAGNEAARGYLDGRMTKEQAMQWLMTYGLFNEQQAEQRVRFIETYRSYVINYNYGMDLVRGYVERNGGTVDAADRRWAVFADLLSSPRLASSLKPASKEND